jgi:hypothetical protein
MVGGWAYSDNSPIESNAKVQACALCHPKRKIVSQDKRLMLTDSPRERTAVVGVMLPVHESSCVASAIKRKLSTGAQRTSGQV